MVKTTLFSGLLLVFAAAPRVEEQRKYSLPAQARWPEENFRLDEFRFLRHEVYRAEDIYFCDPKDELVAQGLGLRLRKVTKGARPAEYVLQLKSEMEEAGGVRLEEESREIDFQTIEGQALRALVDRVIEAKVAAPAEQALLARWVARKMSSSLAPFQELRRRKLTDLALRPVIVGVSQRQRYHVYVDRGAQVGPLMLLSDSEKNPLRTPAIFRTHSDWVWLMEASHDNSLFYSLARPRSPYRIEEIEVENKYRPREMGTQLMDRLEPLLVARQGLVVGAASKFIRAYTQLKKVTP